MHYIGKLDLNKIGNYKKIISTTDVILTDERKHHIQSHHIKDYIEIINNIDRVVLHPNEILEDIKNENTLFFIGKLNHNNLNVIVKLCTNDSKDHRQNSVMTAWIIRDINLKKLRKKNKILYKEE